jgi:hypothetical protein
MRAAIFAYIDAGGEGIDQPVREALLKLKDEAKSPGDATHIAETSFQGT